MVKSPWVYRRLRNFGAAIEAGISCFKRAYGSTLHLARARPLQGLHLVGGSGPQPGPARPPQTGLASPAAAGDSAAGRNRPVRPCSLYDSLALRRYYHVKMRRRPPQPPLPALATPLKSMPLWMGTSYATDIAGRTVGAHSAILQGILRCVPDYRRNRVP